MFFQIKFKLKYVFDYENIIHRVFIEHRVIQYYGFHEKLESTKWY